MRKLVAALLGVSAFASPAFACDQPLYHPAPDWVLPPPQEVSHPADQPGSQTLDVQQRIEKGEVWTYTDAATRIDSPEALTRAGTLTASWAPDHGDLIVHSVTIVRGGQRIDALASGAKFTVLRREGQLESLALNGILTATLAVQGLQVGDTLEMRISRTDHDPTLLGHADGAAPLIALPARLNFGRARVLWKPDDKVQWKAYLDGVAPTETIHDGWHELVVNFPIAKQPDPAAQVPGRFARPPMIEFSDFADWADVSRTFAPLYRTDIASAAIKPGGDLDGEVARIAAASSDPRKRAALALQLVQDKVRYFFVGMDGGNYVPQTPEDTWAKRYGDCKAKTLLLLAVLHKLGIDAEPALANLDNGDIVHDRLPSAGAFNHVFVLAHVGGATLWLEGTALGDRADNLDDVRAYHWVLPLRAAGAELIEAPTKAPARSVLEQTAEVDMRGGLDRLAPCRVSAVIHGGAAGQLNTMIANLDREARIERLRGFLVNAARCIAVGPQFSYDAATGTGIVSAEGIANPHWTRADSRYSYNSGMFAATNYPDRSRTIWQSIPIASGSPIHSSTELKIQLPRGGDGIAMEGSADLQSPHAGGGSVSVKAELGKGVWDVTSTNLRDGGEFAASEIPALRREDAEFVAKAPTLRTVAGYPAPWEGIEQAKHDHLFDRTISILGQYIAEKPEDAGRYQARASFYASIYEREKAIADLTKVLELKADKPTYRERSSLYEEIGDKKNAIADAKAAVDLDPSDLDALGQLAQFLALSDGKDDALARIDARVADGGDKVPGYLSMKALILAYAGNSSDALAQIDAALEKRSGNGAFLNRRCLLKGLLNTGLDTAADDCNRAIELTGSGAAAALENRGLVHLRQHQLKEAATDLDAAIDQAPNARSYFLRALVERDDGQGDKAKRDLAAARLLNPAVEDLFGRFGLRW